MVNTFDTAKYENLQSVSAKPLDVINDVAPLKSEIGILYLSDFNRKLLKLLNSNGLVFNKLIDCDAYVYLWKGHPLTEITSQSHLKSYLD